MPKSIQTYCRGFKLTAHTDITEAQMVRLCRDLDEAFDSRFEPEPIGNGFVRWHGAGEYKSMRLFRSPDPRSAHYRWPWVPLDVMQAWEHSERVLIPKGKYTTCLKAFDSAPAWTKEELRKFELCLAKIGMRAGKCPRRIY